MRPRRRRRGKIARLCVHMVIGEKIFSPRLASPPCSRIGSAAPHFVKLSIVRKNRFTSHALSACPCSAHSIVCGEWGGRDDIVPSEAHTSEVIRIERDLSSRKRQALKLLCGRVAQAKIARAVCLVVPCRILIGDEGGEPIQWACSWVGLVHPLSQRVDLDSRARWQG